MKDFFYACGILIIEGYGLTETSPTLTLNRPDAFRFDIGRQAAALGRAQARRGRRDPRARARRVRRLPQGSRRRRAEAFTDDGWFKTGDVGRFTDDGFLQIIDRKKDILVTAGGKNVPPANIELRFRDDPFIAHVVVYGEAQEVPRRRRVARTRRPSTRTSPTRASPDGARRGAHARSCRSASTRSTPQLASYETIKKFAIIDAPLTVEDGLLTPTLKVRRKKVYERFRDAFEALYEAPSERR